MSVEEILLRRWGASDSLCEIVPVSRVFSSTMAGAKKPFIVLLREIVKPTYPTTGTTGPATFTLRLELHHDSFDAAEEMLDRVVAELNGVRFPTDDGRTLILRFVARHHNRPGETDWTCIAEFRGMLG